MSATVVHLRKCLHCGKPAERRDIVYRGDKVADTTLCDECNAGWKARMDRCRPVFDAMLAAGANRAIANDVMALLLTQMDDAGLFEAPLETTMPTAEQHEQRQEEAIRHLAEGLKQLAAGDKDGAVKKADHVLALVKVDETETD